MAPMQASTCAAVLALALVALPACSEEVDPLEAVCQDYCELVQRNCSGAVGQYSDLATCKATCRAMPPGDPASPAGNTIACRTFYAGIAENPAASACTTAGPGGNGTCGESCDSFCTLALELCGGQPGSFPDLATCTTQCAGFDQTEVYDFGDVAGDTFACRLYHLTAASVAPDVHCSHIVENSPVCL
jgi:hypothetical protein